MDVGIKVMAKPDVVGYSGTRKENGYCLLDFYGKLDCNSSLEIELWGIY